MSGVNVRNLEKIQDKWLLFQRFVTSIVVPLVRRLSRSDKVSGIRLGAGHDTRSNKIHCNTAKLSSKVSLSEKVYCIIITERAVSSGPNDLPLRATILDRKGKEKVIPPFPQKLMIKPCKGQNTPLSR